MSRVMSRTMPQVMLAAIFIDKCIDNMSRCILRRCKRPWNSTSYYWSLVSTNKLNQCPWHCCWQSPQQIFSMCCKLLLPLALPLNYPPSWSRYGDHSVHWYCRGEMDRLGAHVALPIKIINSIDINFVRRHHVVVSSPELTLSSVITHNRPSTMQGGMS